MKICEIFYSIEGESTYAGLPCVFIRTSGCNLDCTWCDTRYAQTEGIEINLDEIIKEVSKYQTKLICLTGGEPLLQEESTTLVKKLISLGYTCLIETNGSLSLKDIPDEAVKIVDIKTPSSKMDQKNLWDNLKYLNKADEIKFVIQDRNDYDYAKEIIKKHNLNNICKILFGPVSQRLNPTELAEWILKDRLDVRLQLQLHKLLWDNARGK